MAPECLICAKHDGRGPLGGRLIARQAGFWIWHAPAGPDGVASLGHLIVESDRHAPYLDDLTDAEAAQLGRLRSRLAGALRAETGAELVLAAVIGRQVPHFHEHLLCRFPGTDPDVPWHESDEAAPRADDETVDDLTRGLLARLDA